MKYACIYFTCQLVNYGIELPILNIVLRMQKYFSINRITGIVII